MRVCRLAWLVAALLPGFALANNAQASRYYEDALNRFEQKDLPGAIIQLKNALQVDKTLLSGQLLLGRALLQNGEVAAAEVALKEALRLGVNRAEVVLPLGQAYLAQGKHKQIFDQPDMRLDGLPTDVRRRLLLLRASASADLGNAREALQAIDEARTMDTRSADAWLAEVPVRIRERQFDLARTAANRAQALVPDSAEVWYQQATVAHVSGQLKEALANYDRSLKLDMAHTEARVARAGLLIDLGRFADAARDIEELRKTSPKEPRAAYLRALLAERDGKPEEVRAALGEVTSLIDPVPPDFIRYRPQLLMLNGLAHFGLNEHEKARDYLESFQRAQGTTPVAKLLAQLYLAEGRTDRAVDLLEAYLKQNATDGQALSLLGQAFMAKGQHARAVGLMQQALKAQDAPEHRTVLGMSLIKSGQTASGMAELELVWQKNPQQLQAGSALAALYLQARQPAKAVKVADALIKLQPKNAEFHNLLGMAKAQAGDRTAARAAFEKAAALDDKALTPQLNLARLDIVDKAYPEAERRLNAVLKRNDRNAEAHFELGILAERRGQWADAERWLKKAVDLSAPKEVRWALALADYHQRRAQPAPALEAVKIAASKLPDDVPVLLALARLQLVNGDADTAKSTLTKATRLAGYRADDQVRIALLQLSANYLQGAAFSLEKALSGQADHLPAQALMAEVELKQGDPAKAEKRAREIVAQHPKRAVGHGLLGDIANTRGQGAAALDFYRKAHQVEPSTDTLLRLFNAHVKVGAGGTAVQLAEQWLKAHPLDVAVMGALADAQSRAKNYAAARKTYEKALKETPNDGALLNNLANVLFELKDASALAIAEQAVAKSPGNPLAIDTLGWGLFQAGETDRGLQLLRDARLRAPAVPDIRYHLGAALAQLGKKEEAIEELAAAVASNVRHFEHLDDARSLLESLRRR